MGARETFRDEVAERFGVLPSFFCSAQAAPGRIERLWDFAKSAISITRCLHSSKSDCSSTSRAFARRAIASSDIQVS